MNRIAVLMPGQGTQRQGMGRNLYESSDAARMIFNKANDLLGYRFTEIIFNEKHEEIMDTKHVQMAIFLTSMAYYKEFIETKHIVPCCIAGHSIGEYAALTCAGVISFDDALKLVEKRGTFMHDYFNAVEPGAMAAISGVSVKVLQEQCLIMNNKNKPVCISNYNSDNEMVISGLESNINEISDILNTLGASIKKLKVKTPFHSEYMQEAADLMQQEIKNVKFLEPQFTVMSNLTGRPYTSNTEIKEMLALQMVKPVLWNSIMENMLERGIDYFVEMGESHILANLIRKKGYPSICARSLDTDLAKEEYQNDLRDNRHIGANYKLKRMLGIAVSTKNKIQQREEYEKYVIPEYNQIDTIRQKVEKENRTATINEVQEAYRHLVELLRLKQAPEEEVRRKLLELEI